MTQTGKTEWWRTVLGEYPSGVVLITSLGPDGEPVGMVVGTFTAVSQSPPLVGFLPDAGSTTFPLVAAHGGFAVSVLGAAHEALCRAFARKDPDRFARGAFVPTTSGIPRLADAVAWFDVSIERRERFGDHDFVVGEVLDFGVGTADAGLPMLFRRGGYGVFAVPSEDLDIDTLARRLSAADEATEILVALADELQRQIVVSTAVRDSVVVLSAVRPTGSAQTRPGRRRIGETFPLAAPMAPLFVAWAPPERQTAWIEGSRHLVGSVDRAQFAALLADVRRRGFGLSANRALAARFDTVVAGDGPRRESFARLWSDVAAEQTEIASSAAVQAPVFAASGEVELVLTVVTDEDGAVPVPVDALAERLLAGAEKVTHHLGGAVPEREAA